MRSVALVFLCLFFTGLNCGAQKSNSPQAQNAHHDMQNMPGMEHQNESQMRGMQMGNPASMEPKSLIELLQGHATSGTDAEPNSTPFEMLMTTKKNWTFMFHGEAFLLDTQQSGPRGSDKF